MLIYVWQTDRGCISRTALNISHSALLKGDKIFSLEVIMVMKFLIRLILIILVFKMSSVGASDKLPEVEWKQLAKLNLDVDTIPEDVHKVLKRISITGYMLENGEGINPEKTTSFIVTVAPEFYKTKTLPKKNQMVRVILNEAVKTSAISGELTLHGELTAEYSRGKKEWSYVLRDASVSKQADLVKVK